MKKITLFAGHYGSGKTSIAVSYAKYLKKQGKKVKIVDLDIVNPYFRTKDSEEDLKAHGIEVISSAYANTNLDAPALPKEIYAVLTDADSHIIIDVGGDDRGAVALGRYTPDIVEKEYEMVFVANCYRPLTKTPEDALEIMREIEAASKLPFTAIVNNSNLGAETTAKTVLDSLDYVKEISRKTSLPVLMTTVNENLLKELSGKIDNLYSLSLQKNVIKEK